MSLFTRTKRIFLLKNVDTFLKTLLLTFVLLCLFFVSSIKSASAATVTWDGEGTDETCGGGVGDGNKWSCGLNWSTNAIPTSADVATFNTTSVKNATMDATINVIGINIASGYSGTISPSSAIAITIGTTGYVQAGGTFTATSGTTTLTGLFTKTGGTFTHNDGTFVFTGASVSYNSNTTQSFYNLTINKTAGRTLSIVTGAITVEGTLNLTQGLINTGTIDARGNINQASTFGGGSAIIDFGDNDLAQTYTINGGTGPRLRFDHEADVDDTVVMNAAASLYSVIITSDFDTTVPIDSNVVPFNYNGNGSGPYAVTVGEGGFSQASGTFSAPTSLTITGNFTKTGGTFNEGTGLINFAASGVRSVDVVVSETFYNVILNATAASYGITIASGDTIIVTGNLTLTNGEVNAGTIDARGNINQASTFNGGTAIIDFGNDDYEQTYIIDGGAGPNLRFDSTADASDEVIFNTDATLNGLTITAGFAGTVPMTFNGYDLQIEGVGYTQGGGEFLAPSRLSIGHNGNTSGGSSFTKTGGTFNAGEGTVVFNYNNTTINASPNIEFYNVEVDKFRTVNRALTITEGQTVIVNGTLTLSRGSVDSGTFDARGDVILQTTFYGGTSPLVLSGSAVQTFTTNNATTFNADITISKSGGQVNLVGNLIMDAASQDLIIQEGTLDLNGSNLTVTGGATQTFVVQDGGVLRLQGGETITASALYPQFQAGSTVYYDGTSGPYTLKDYTYSNLTIDGAGTTFNLPSEKTLRDLTITAGTLDVTENNYALGISGNWSNSGTFTPQTGTVTFNGTDAGKTISGTTTFNNVIVNGTAGGWTIDTGTVTIPGVLTLTDGALTNDATLSLTGTGTTLSIASGKTFTNNGTFNLGGTGVVLTGTWTNAVDSTVVLIGVSADTAITIPNVAYGNFQINNDGTTFTPTATLVVNGSVTLTAGALDVDNTDNYSITVAGSWTDTVSGDNFIERAGTVTFSNNGTVNSNEPFYHIILNGADKTLTLGSNLDVNGNLTLTAGTFDQSATNFNINLAGNLTNNAVLNGRAGTVTLDGGDQQLLGSSDTTFYNLTKQVSSPQTLIFKNGRTFTVTHTVTLTGIEGNILSLRSDSEGNQWKLDPQGTRVIEYVDVKDSNNLNATAVTCDTGCVNSRNNIAWIFPVQGIAYATDGTTPLASKTVALSVNGATPVTASTNGSGAFSLNPGNLNDGDILTVFLKNNVSHKGVTVTITDGASTNALHIIQDSLTVRNEATGPITVATLDTANNSDDSDIDAIYTLDGSGNLVLATDKNLSISVSSTFTPGKNVSANNITISGTFVPEANTVNTAGSWLNSGTFTKGTSTVNFGGTTAKTLTSGGSAFNNITLNGSGLHLNQQDNLTVNGALVITQGNLDLNSYDLTNTGGTFSNSDTLTIQGSEAFTGFTNDPDSGTTVFDGTGTYLTIPLNSFNHIIFNGVGGIWTLNQDIVAGGDITLTAGTVNGGTRTITVAGSWTDTTDLFSQDTSTIKLTGTGTLNESGNLYNLNIDSSGTVTMASVLNINNNLTITAGTLDTSASNLAINLTGNWSNVAGTFNPRNGTVSLVGTNQSISGDNTFYNLTKETSDATLSFENGKTQTIQNIWTAKGTNGHNILLRSTSEGNRWKVSPANYTLQYVDIKDSDNISGVTIIAANDATNSGNNNDWAFPLVITVYSDKGVTKIGQNKSVSVSVNGGAKKTNTTTADSTALFNDGDEDHTIAVSSGDVVTMWLDGNTEKGVTVTITNGTSLSFDIFQDYLTVQHETGSQITNTNLDTANNVSSSELDAVYTIQDSDITLATGKSLYIKSGSTYVPGGGVSAHDVIISGTFTMGANDVSVGGSWDATGGAFTGTNTVTFTSTAPEFITSNNNAFNNVSFEANSDADTGRWTTTDKFVVNGTNTMSIATPADVPDTTDPSISSILATAADTSASISWTTNESADSKLEYGTSDSLGTETTDTTMTLRHSITLTGLTSNTTYKYRITSKDPSNNDAVSDIGTFTTLAEGSVLDTTAPSITATTTSDISATLATVNWTTNEDAVGYVDYGTTTTYNRGANPGTSIYQRSQSAVLTGLTAGTTYHYRVVAIDASGNMTKGEDKTLETSTSTDTTDTTAPTISNIGSASVTGSGVTISWTTNEESTASLDYGESTSYNRGATSGAGDKTGKAFSVTLSGLSPATTYHYRVVAIDVAGNKALSNDYTFLTLSNEASVEATEVLNEVGSRSSSDAPKLSSDAPSVTDISGNQVTVSWKTDKKSTSVVYYRELNTTINPLKQGDVSYVQNHQLTISGLKEATTYEYSVESRDPEGAVMQSKRYEFTTRLPKVKDISVQNLDDVMAKFVYTTENPTATLLELRDVLTGETINIQDDSIVMEHKVTLDNLKPDTEYSAVVLIKGNNNDVKRSMAYIFRTLPDTANPIVSTIETRSAIVEGEKDKVQTIITWNTDEPSTSQIEYNEGLTKGGEFKHKTPEQTDLVTKHVIVLADLSPSTVYEYRVKSVDRAKHATKSDARVLLTPQRRVSAFDLIIRNLEDTFGWTKAIGG